MCPLCLYSRFSGSLRARGGGMGSSSTDLIQQNRPRLDVGFLLRVSCFLWSLLCTASSGPSMSCHLWGSVSFLAGLTCCFFSRFLVGGSSSPMSTTPSRSASVSILVLCCTGTIFVCLPL